MAALLDDRPDVLVDVDDVLADFKLHTLDTLYNLTGRRIDPVDVTTWEIFDSLPSFQSVKKQVFDLMKSHGSCSSLPICIGAVEGLKALREIANVTIVTSPFSGSETWMHERELWLLKHFGVAAEDIVHAKKKFRIHGDYLIDDKPEHVEKWIEYWRVHNHRGEQGILWANAGRTDCPKYLRRFDNWPDVVDFIRRTWRVVDVHP